MPVLGLSATAIRYLDNQRDMTDELFDGNVASEMIEMMTETDKELLHVIGKTSSDEKVCTGDYNRF